MKTTYADFTGVFRTLADFDFSTSPEKTDVRRPVTIENLSIKGISEIHSREDS